MDSSEEEGKYLKPRSSRNRNLAVTFDEKSRRGFRKRKNERRKKAVDEGREKQKQERKDNRRRNNAQLKRLMDKVSIPTPLEANELVEAKDADEVKYTGIGGVSIVRTVDLTGAGAALPPNVKSDSEEEEGEEVNEEIDDEPASKKRKWVPASKLKKKQFNFVKGKKKRTVKVGKSRKMTTKTKGSKGRRCNC